MEEAEIGAIEKDIRSEARNALYYNVKEKFEEVRLMLFGVNQHTQVSLSVNEVSLSLLDADGKEIKGSGVATINMSLGRLMEISVHLLTRAASEEAEKQALKEFLADIKRYRKERAEATDAAEFEEVE